MFCEFQSILFLTDKLVALVRESLTWYYAAQLSLLADAIITSVVNPMSAGIYKRGTERPL
jgi:hypothetical protein